MESALLCIKRSFDLARVCADIGAEFDLIGRKSVLSLTIYDRRPSFLCFVSGLLCGRRLLRVSGSAQAELDEMFPGTLVSLRDIFRHYESLASAASSSLGVSQSVTVSM